MMLTREIYINTKGQRKAGISAMNLYVLICLMWSKFLNLFLVALKFLKWSNLILLFLMSLCFNQNTLAQSNVIWNTQSNNSSESMPVGGGDIGLNLWVEKGEVYLYLSRSGSFDENNTLLKLGRVKLKLSPNPFEGESFKQELNVKDGYAQVSGAKGKLKSELKIWVDVFLSLIHI